MRYPGQSRDEHQTSFLLIVVIKNIHFNMETMHENITCIWFFFLRCSNIRIIMGFTGFYRRISDALLCRLRDSWFGQLVDIHSAFAYGYAPAQRSNNAKQLMPQPTTYTAHTARCLTYR